MEEKVEEFIFTVDGEQYNLKNVPNKALAILKNQALTNLSIINSWKKRNNLIKKFSDGLMFVGLGTYLLSFWLPFKGRLISQIITCLTIPISIITEKIYRKNNAKIQPQDKGFSKIQMTLDGELQSREFVKEAFPDCFDEQLLKPVDFCYLDVEFEV